MRNSAHARIRNSSHLPLVNSVSTAIRFLVPSALFKEQEQLCFPGQQQLRQQKNRIVSSLPFFMMLLINLFMFIF